MGADARRRPSGSRSSRLERWSALARGWLERLPDELHELLRQRAHAVWGQGLLDYLGWLYPAGGTWIRERTTQAAREAELLGITGGSTPSTPGTALLVDGPEAATAAMAELFPAEVDKVYLQPDLSIIAPGPAASPRSTTGCAAMAEVETRGLASSYRVTAGSVTRALIAGRDRAGDPRVPRRRSRSPASRSRSSTCSPTPPQRFGTLRVGAIDPARPTPMARMPARAAYVRSDDAALLGQLVVDPGLAPLALRRSGEHRIVTPLRRRRAVLDPRRRALPGGRRGCRGRACVVAAPRAAGRRRVRAERRHRGDPDRSASRAVAAGEPEETSQAWLARQLELAIRNKLTVTVAVRLPDGTETDYLLEPAALAGGRLRARDRRADIERTLPLSSITARHRRILSPAPVGGSQVARLG